MADRDRLELAIHFIVSAIVGAVIGVLVVPLLFSAGTIYIVAGIAVLFGIAGAYMGDEFWHAAWNPIHWWR